MKSLIVAAPVLLALVSGPALAQSADPAKRHEWALKMAQCMSIVEQLPDDFRVRHAQICKRVSHRVIESNRRDRFAQLESARPVSNP